MQKKAHQNPTLMIIISIDIYEKETSYMLHHFVINIIQLFYSVNRCRFHITQKHFSIPINNKITLQSKDFLKKMCKENFLLKLNYKLIKR